MMCRDLYGFLDEFLAGGMDPHTHMLFKAHLAVCGACRRYLRTYRTTIEVAKHSEDFGLPAECKAPEELVRAILAARPAALVTPPPE